MKIINRAIFFAQYRSLFGRIKHQSVVDNLEQLLDFIEKDWPLNQNIHYMAYMLATVRHETGYPKTMFSPLEEWGKGRLPHQRKYGKKKENGHRYYGRGYVQLTWDWNYKRMGVELIKAYPSFYGHLYDDFLYDKPELALDPYISYHILSLGMRKGFFTGKKLADYARQGDYDYYHARRIINGMDRAKKIALYAEKFEKALRASVELI